jgi:hypothetical protein
MRLGGQPHTPGALPVPIVKEGGSDPGLVWTDLKKMKSLASVGIWTRERPAGSKSLRLLRYHDPWFPAISLCLCVFSCPAFTSTQESWQCNNPIKFWTHTQINAVSTASTIYTPRTMTVSPLRDSSNWRHLLSVFQYVDKHFVAFCLVVLRRALLRCAVCRNVSCRVVSCIVLRCVVLCRIVLGLSFVVFCIISCRVALCYGVMSRRVLSRRIVSCWIAVVSCCVVLCYVLCLSRCIVLCCIVLSQPCRDTSCLVGSCLVVLNCFVVSCCVELLLCRIVLSCIVLCTVSCCVVLCRAGSVGCFFLC